MSHFFISLLFHANNDVLEKEPEKAEPTSIEQLKECLLELKNYDGSIENVSILGDLLELTQNAGKELLENDQLYENVFDK